MPKITSLRDLLGLRSYNYIVIDGEDRQHALKTDFTAEGGSSMFY